MVAPALEYSTVPVEGVNVPVMVKGVLEPVRVKVFEPSAEKTWESSIVKLVILAEAPRFRVVLVELTDT